MVQSVQSIETIRARASVEISIKDFGSADDRIAYSDWVGGNEPMTESLREIVVSCLHRRLDFLRRQSRSPLINEAEIIELRSQIGYLARLTERLDEGQGCLY